MPLTNLQIKNAPIGTLSDGGGLYLAVTSKSAKSWIYRYQLKGKRREMGLRSAGRCITAPCDSLPQPCESGWLAEREAERLLSFQHWPYVAGEDPMGHKSSPDFALI